MRISLLIATTSLLALLITVNRLSDPRGGSLAGGLPWVGWAATGLILVMLALYFMWRRAARARRLLGRPAPVALKETEKKRAAAQELRKSYDSNGLDYPHPVIIANSCIACGQCVEACPHDVLTVGRRSDGKGHVATVARPELCMEDTACEAACPVQPKACLVINSVKEVKRLPSPVRDESFMTRVKGCYVVGDVSGMPLIKNAVREGASVIQCIAGELPKSPPEPKAALDVVVVGIGPAGLSAVLSARQQGLRFLGLEQDKVLATIRGYPEDKNVQFMPEHVVTDGPLRIERPDSQRDELLNSWGDLLAQSGVPVLDGHAAVAEDGPGGVIIENECCTSVRRAEDGDYFVVTAGKVGEDKQQKSYSARRVVLAIGLRGSPTKLGGKNEMPDENLMVERGGKRRRKVMYRLTNPGEFKRLKLIVVGGGNSAIETAVDLVARRHGGRIEFLDEEEANDVTLLVRSGFKNDVKFKNKQQVYECIDEGKIKVFFGTSVKEIRDGEVVLQNARTEEVKATIPNDFIFAMIGGERPDKFLSDIGIEIPKVR